MRGMEAESLRVSQVTDSVRVVIAWKIHPAVCRISG
jgi:hypothetical protein